MFVSVYDTLDGVNGRRSSRTRSGRPAVTDSAPAAAFTVRPTARVVFPVPLVVFVSVTVSL